MESTQKHAYLIMAHNNLSILKDLLEVLDDPRNDIYLHIDKKFTSCPIEELKTIPKAASISIYQEFSVAWGTTDIMDCEVFLLKQAVKKEHQYYHLLSGADFPIKSQDEIHSFFNQHNGTQFVHFDDTYLNTTKEPYRRCQYYCLFERKIATAHSRHGKKIYQLLRKAFLGIQTLLPINRWKHKKEALKYGANWFSITHKLAIEVVHKEAWLQKTFTYSHCCDELFLQTILYNSPNSYSICQSNLRLVDFKRNQKQHNTLHPYVWRSADLEELLHSKELFARKFDEGVDYNIVQTLKKKIEKMPQ